MNLAGGQPISLANLRARARRTRATQASSVILDATRAVENAWFIQQREPGNRDKTVAQILREMCDCADGATMSGKKDSLVNIGGWLGLRDDDARRARRGISSSSTKGLHTYGGLAGRDMEAMAIGIEESVQEDYIRARIGQVHYLGDKLIRRRRACRATDRRPCRLPRRGGDSSPSAARRSFLRRRWPRRSMLDSGIRAMERGTVSAGRDRCRPAQNRFPALELVRLTIPRRVYTQAHMDVMAESVDRDLCAAGAVPGLALHLRARASAIFPGAIHASTGPANLQRR